jgi:hypothetical protein
MERLQPCNIYSHLRSPGPSVWYSGLLAGYRAEQQIPQVSRALPQQHTSSICFINKAHADGLETIRSLEKTYFLESVVTLAAALRQH